MRRFEEDPRWNRASNDRIQAGFPSAQAQLGISPDGMSSSGSSRLQLVPSQRNRPPPRKPPEPLRRAVASCLSASHHAIPEAVRTLQDYLSNPLTVDLAYTVLLEHANAEKDRSPPVIAKCVGLLKKYLVRYVPKQHMLQQVDAFCAGLIVECNSFTKAPMASPFVQLANEPAYMRQTGSTYLNSISPGLTRAAFASPALVKSLTYVRALVARHLPSNLLQSATTVDISHARLKHSRSFKPPYGPGGVLKQGSYEGKVAAKSAVMHILGLGGNGEDTHFIAVDILKSRWMGGKRQQCWTPSPVMTDSGGIARPQVKRLYEFLDMGAGALSLKGSNLWSRREPGKVSKKKHNSESIIDQLLQPSTVTTASDNTSARSHMRAIVASKRQKSQSHQVWDFDVPKSTWRRRPRPLFQYKHYSEQQPLCLSSAEMEEVIAAFCVEGSVIGSNTLGIVPSLPGVPPGRLSLETADVAGSVLIKLIMDMFMTDSHTATPLTLHLLEGMLNSSTVAVRTRCFDLLLNLGIHAHLLEPMQMEDQSTMEEDSNDGSAHLGGVTPFSSSKRGINLEEAFRDEEALELARPQLERGSLKGSTNKSDSGISQAVQGFEVWLLHILFEMLLFLVQIGEVEEGVWVAALSCLLYLVCDRGRVQKRRLHGMDIRVLKNLLNVSWENDWAEELHCTLVCMMSNLLYQTSINIDDGLGQKLTFDLEKLELLGGIEFISIEYARAKSTEVRRNLFSIVMDYVVLELNEKLTLSGKSLPGIDEIQAVVAALILADAPEALGIAFKHGLKNVGEGLLKSITAALSRDVDSGRLNSGVLEQMMGMIDALVAAYSNPAEEFAEMMSLTMADDGLSSVQSSSPHKDSVDPNILSQAWATLHALLHSSRLVCRFHGYSWLVELLSSEMTQGGSTKVKPKALQYQLGVLRNMEMCQSDKKIDMSSSGICSAVQLLCGLLKSRHAFIRRGFILVLERVLVKCQQTAMESDLAEYNVYEREATQGGDESFGLDKWEHTILDLMNGALWQIVSANDTDRINILEMCNVMFSQLCVMLPSSSKTKIAQDAQLEDNGVLNRLASNGDSNGRLFSSFLKTERRDKKQNDDEGRAMLEFNSSSAWKQSLKSISGAAMLLNGQAAAPKVLVASMPTDLLYWPLLQLAGAATEDMALGVAVGSRGRGRTPGGTSDVRTALLALLIGKCSVQQTAFDEVGGEEFFRSLLDDMDARVAYYTASFLMKRMMTEEPEKYQRVLHSLVFRAQQSNNEKLLENPYLQMCGILQLSSDLGSQLSFQEA